MYHPAIKLLAPKHRTMVSKCQIHDIHWVDGMVCQCISWLGLLCNITLKQHNISYSLNPGQVGREIYDVHN